MRHHFIYGIEILYINIMNQLKEKIWRIAPAITLMFMAPLLTEVLPGATRLSSMFVFPIEFCVWGGGAVLIRYAARRWELGWLHILFLALALALAEECLIQQTSLAPLVIKLKGLTYARFLGVNYVYLLWALIYEPIFVVFLPIYLVELIFPARSEDLWLNKKGLISIILLFILGSYLAWFTWTQIARPKIFHMPVYHPPLITIALAILLIAGLCFIATGPFRNKFVLHLKPLKPLSTWIIGVSGALWAFLLYGILLLGFGILPTFPSVIAVGLGILLGVGTILLVTHWTSDERWKIMDQFGLISGVIIGSMLSSQIGFLWSSGPDVYFKIITNILAVIMLVLLRTKIKKRMITQAN